MIKYHQFVQYATVLTTLTEKIKLPIAGRDPIKVT